MQGHHRLAALQTVVHLQTVTVRQELAHVLCIAMTKARAPQAVAIIIHSHRPIHHLIFTIAVEVGHGERMVALSTVGAIGLAVLVGILTSRLCTVKTPAASQLSVLEVPSLEH